MEFPLHVPDGGEVMNILPCPVCGAGGTVFGLDNLPNRVYVSCADSECSVCGPFGKDDSDAIDKWNNMPRRGA